MAGIRWGRTWDMCDDTQLQETPISEFPYCSSHDSSVGKRRFLFIYSFERDSLSTYYAPGCVHSSENKAENKTDSAYTLVMGDRQVSR